MAKQSVLQTGFVGVLVLTAGGRPAPTTAHYRVETRNETTVDLSSFGAPSQQQNFSLTSWIAVTVADSAGGRTVHITVDSMTYQGTIPQLSQANADSAKGGTIHGFVDQDGRVKNLVSKPEALLLADLQGVVHGLFPKVKPGAKAGDTWTDTLEVTNTANGANLKSKFQIAYTSVGSENVSGMTGLKLSATIGATITGTMQNPQMGTMEVEGKVQGSSTSIIGDNGRFLGGNSSSTSDQLLKTPMAAVPVKTVRTATITYLP